MQHVGRWRPLVQLRCTQCLLVPVACIYAQNNQSHHATKSAHTVCYSNIVVFAHLAMHAGSLEEDVRAESVVHCEGEAVAKAVVHVRLQPCQTIMQ